jgi:hypothetical protein
MSQQPWGSPPPGSSPPPANAGWGAPPNAAPQGWGSPPQGGGPSNAAPAPNAGAPAWGAPPAPAPAPQGWSSNGAPAPDPAHVGQTANANGGWNGGPTANPGYGPGPGDNRGQQNPALAKLESDSTTWLIVVLAGFFLSFGWLTGPLGWYMGSKFRAQYAAMGLPHGSNADLTYYGGIVSTVLYYGAILLSFAFVLMMVFGLFAVGGAAALAN